MSAEVIALVWQKFICRACGLIYDEARGDADGGLAPGTRFADIPEDWACPLCGVTKSDFEPYDELPLQRRAARSDARPRRAAGRAGAGVVIVGAGRAGWQMAEALRERDRDVPITMVAACDAAVYDKPQLSIALAKGIAVDALVKEAAGSAAARLGVRLLAHTQATGVVAAASLLRTTRGALRFRDLVLAHGAAPRAVQQLPAALCWRINDLTAYRRFRAALGEPSLTANQGIVIAGAGLVGCEIANDLALAGHAVTLLDIAERPLAALLDAQRSAQLLDAWRALPIAFVGGVRVAGVERRVTSDDAGRLVVSVDDGRRFEAGHVLSAIGLETPGRLARSAGLAWDHGIVVDPVSLATSQPHIHALGDCISIDGRALRYIEPITRQARLIADRITGRQPDAYRVELPPVRIKTSSLPFTV